MKHKHYFFAVLMDVQTMRPEGMEHLKGMDYHFLVREIGSGRYSFETIFPE
jgi:hypothetical protein